jgi:hypothetical protein
MQMKKIVNLMIITAFMVSFSGSIEAKSERKNPPKGKVVEQALVAAGTPHFPSKMKVGNIGSIKFQETYYHAFCGALENDQYRAILFDNKENYLGYYESEYEPIETEEGGLVLDINGEDTHSIPLEKNGPKKRVKILGTWVSFVKNDRTTSVPNTTESDSASIKLVQPEYREWVLINHGKEIPVEAIFVKKIGNKVTLQKKSDGRSKEFPMSMLSRADQDYVEKLN